MIDSSRKLIWEVSETEYGRERPTAFLFLVLVATISSWAHTLDGKWNTGLQLERNKCFLPVHSAVSFLPWKFPCLHSSWASWSTASHTIPWKATEKLWHCDGNVGAGRGTEKRQGCNDCRRPLGKVACKNNGKGLSSYCVHFPSNGSMSKRETNRFLDHSCTTWHFQHHRTYQQ